ncbi:hypothetical protein J1N09_10255 [Aureitalea sp. L0-47]|uniref:TapB family protein n=1 Tax=Aureitalea sp. L0-47 TaxID=2816962 RepID=UPI0022381418|nr:hypothetical protein [Aureitalea sp. L0-47]MCW5520221.1 hypothetical protein [Aureitalea sp. L0-47]
MKKIITIFTLSLMISSTVNAQDCSKYYPFTEGAVSQLTMYNAKGKSQGMVEYHINSVSSTGDATIANMTMKLIDKKGKEMNGTEYEATCKEGVVSIDFKSLMGQGMLAAYGEEMETDVKGTNLDLPNDLSVGQSLPDAEIIVTMSMSGMNFTMSTLITDRKVLATETVTVPAGTFPCYVLTQTTRIKSMAANQSRTSKQWIAEGVGVVKSEDYNKKGKLDGTSVLTSFTK